MIAASALLDPCSLRQYEREGHDALSTGERILLALRWFDWITGDGLYDAMGCVDQHDRNRHASALLRLRKLGRVEMRGTGWRREYRLRVKRRRRHG